MQKNGSNQEVKFFNEFLLLLDVNLEFEILGKMFPSRGDLHIAPFNDETLYMEQFNKANFWYESVVLCLKLYSFQQIVINRISL